MVLHLPTEVLKLILLHLHQEWKVLSKVLRVNHLFLNLGAPILYSNPFDAFDVGDHAPDLCLILLRSVNLSPASYIATCNSGTGPDTTPTDTADASAQLIPPTMAPYLNYLTVVDSSRWHLFAFKSCALLHQPSVGTRFCHHILSTILTRTHQRLTDIELFSGNISPFVPFATRMRSLTRIRTMGGFNRQHLDPLLDFLKARQNAGLQISYFNLPQVLEDRDMDAEALNQLQKMQLDIILALGRPISLEANNCNGLSKIGSDIPVSVLERLTEFKHVLGYLDGDGGQLLEKCRALQDLSFASYDKDVFAWASKERRLVLGMARTSLDTGVGQAALDSSLQPLVNLRKLRMAVSYWMPGRVLKSIADGFGHSLQYLNLMVYDQTRMGQVLCSHTVYRLQRNATEDIPICIDRCFRLHQLETLRITCVTKALQFGPGAFEGCPLLKSICIRGDFGVLEGQYDLGIWKIPCLQKVILRGAAAAHFRFESLQYSPSLIVLTLSGGFRVGRACAVPWTWTMENLTDIQLKGDSSRAFRFEWIKSCPSLQFLDVHTIHSEALESIPDPSAFGSYGLQLETCELEFDAKKTEGIGALLVAYCKHTEELEISGRLSVFDRWEHVGLDVILEACQSFHRLKTLTLQGGERVPSVAEEASKYGLVPATLDENKKPVWDESLDLKEWRLEDVSTSWSSLFYRQLRSWAPSPSL